MDENTRTTTNDADEPTVWTATADYYHHSRRCSALRTTTPRARPASATATRRACPHCVGAVGRATDAQLINAVREATAAGDTRINGEPGYEDIAEHLDEMTAHGLRNRLPDLVAAGRLAHSLTVAPGTAGELATFAVPTADGWTEVCADD